MEIGRRYLIRYRSDTQRFEREAVMDYLGEGQAGVDAENYLFNARPLAGTQAMPKRWVQSVTEVPKSSPIVIERRAAGPR